MERVDDDVRAVALRMIELMHEAPGIGLAAPQVGIPWRLFVAHVPKGDWPEEEHPNFMDDPRVYVNPVISDPEPPLEPYEEGCLSLPQIHGDVLRPAHRDDPGDGPGRYAIQPDGLGSLGEVLAA